MEQQLRDACQTLDAEWHERSSTFNDAQKKAFKARMSEARKALSDFICRGAVESPNKSPLLGYLKRKAYVDKWGQHAPVYAIAPEVSVIHNNEPLAGYGVTPEDAVRSWNAKVEAAKQAAE